MFGIYGLRTDCFHATDHSADDQALRIWNVEGKCLLQTLQDRYDRWGQVTCLKWLAFNSSEGSVICFGTGRGFLLVYQGGVDLVSEYPCQASY